MSKLEEEFLQEARAAHPSPLQSQITPPMGFQFDLAEEEADPEERPWYEEVWVCVYDRTNKEGVEIPVDADFVVTGKSWDSLDARTTVLLEKAVKTFPEVEQLVTELWKSYRYVDSFTLTGNYEDPRFIELANSLGLVKQSPEVEAAIHAALEKIEAEIRMNREHTKEQASAQTPQ